MLSRFFLITILFLNLFQAQAEGQKTLAKKSTGFSNKILAAQIALTEKGFSCGSIDGLAGNQTLLAIKAFQASANLPVNGELNETTLKNLEVNENPSLKKYTVSENDLKRLRTLPKTWLEKSQTKSLDFETALELIAEKHYSHPKLIRSLNPQIDWGNIKSGTTVQVPDVTPKTLSGNVTQIKISLSRKTLQVFSNDQQLIAHFPCSIAKRVEKRPVGQLKVVNFAENPVYTFDPENFPESEEARKINKKLILPAGVNNPVGLVWIGLNLPGYGIHGSPAPEEIGRTESHGCFRLTNWDALRLLKLIKVGVNVLVEN